MNEYHKIKTLFYRNPDDMRLILDGQWSQPEFEFLANNPWVWTEKVDGTNIRVMWDGATITFGGKTDNAQLPARLVTTLQGMFQNEERRALFAQLFSGASEVCLYGEGYGKKIQSVGSLYKPDGTDFVLFDIKIGGWWLERSNIEGIAQRLGIQVVPVVGEGTLTEAVKMVKDGFHSQWGEFPAEGLVCRPRVELRDRSSKRIITKIKCRDFAS